MPGRQAWGDDDDDDYLPPRQESAVDSKGVKSIVEYHFNANGAKVCSKAHKLQLIYIVVRGTPTRPLKLVLFGSHWKLVGVTKVYHPLRRRVVACKTRRRHLLGESPPAGRAPRIGPRWFLLHPAAAHRPEVVSTVASRLVYLDAPNRQLPPLPNAERVVHPETRDIFTVPGRCLNLAHPWSPPVLMLSWFRLGLAWQVKRTTKVKVFTEHTRVHKSCLERTKWKKFGLAQVRCAAFFVPEPTPLSIPRFAVTA